MKFFWLMRYSDASCTTRLSNPRVAGSSPAAPTSLKKPVQSQGLSQSQSPDGSFYLRAAFENQLRKVEDLPATRDTWAEYQWLRELRRRWTRGNAGFSPWGPLAFALSVLVAFAIWAHRQSAKDFTYAAPEHKFQVLRRFDAYHYTFRHIQKDKAVELTAVFCPNYEPQLSAGQTLVYLHYQDLGRCWDILPEGYGYEPERDAHGKPTLAPNCFVNDRDVTECKPNQLEARF